MQVRSETTVADGAIDKALLERLRAGDGEAFVEAMRPHQERMLRLVGRFVPTREDAEDVVQEAIVAAYRQVRRFRGDASFGTWICRIAINQAMRLARRQQRIFDASPVHHASPPRDPEGADVLAVREAVARLPEKLRTPVVLRFFEGLSGQDIADVLGCKQSTVWTRLYRGLERLRLDLEEELT